MPRGDRSAEYKKRVRTPTYMTWFNMIQRCRNPKAVAYKEYGGRGITYDPRWAEFKNFLADMGERPEGLTLDREDYNGNYCKENCRWTTWDVQMRNRRRWAKAPAAEVPEKEPLIIDGVEVNI